MIKQFQSQRYFCNLIRLGNLLGIEKINASEGIKDSFNKYSYESNILPMLNEHSKFFPKANKFLFQTAFNKEKKFFLPSISDKSLEHMKDISNHLKNKIDMSDSDITEILYCCPQASLEYSNIIKRNLDFVIDFFKITKDNKDSHKILVDYPKLILVSKENYYKWTSYLIIYLKDEGMTQEIIDELTINNPLIATADPENIERMCINLVEIKKQTVFLCKKNINMSRTRKELIQKCDDYVTEVKSKDQFSQIQEYKPFHKISDNIIENMYKDYQIFNLVRLNPNILVTSGERLMLIFTTLKEKLGIDYYLTIHMITQCPDIMFLNKNGLLEKKVEILLKINIDRFTLKQLFKKYPFMLTKSFNSYLKKYDFLKGLGYKLNGDLNIYPLILLFDFNTEIKPKLTILNNIKLKLEEIKRMENLASFSKSDLDNFNSKLISINRAFLLSKEEFCKEVNVPEEQYTQIVQTTINEQVSNKYDVDLEERDLIFSYSKYTYY